MILWLREMMKRAELLDASQSIFEKAGFNISRRCCSRPSCFDFVVRKKDQLAFVKTHTNIGSALVKEASDLRTISQCFSAAALFIGERTRDKPLEDDAVYLRYCVYTVTLKTLEDVVFRKQYPLVEAGPGGYYVQLDGKVIRERREKLGLSIGKMAEMLGVSRRTLYGYERGMAKASVSTAYNIAWILGVPVAQPINIFKPIKSEGLFATAKRIISKHPFLQKVLSKFAQFNFRVAHISRAPFDFIAQSHEENLSIIGGVVSKKEEPNINKRAEEIISVSKVVNAQPLFITNGKRIPNNNILLISEKELEDIRCPEDLFKS